LSLLRSYESIVSLVVVSRINTIEIYKTYMLLCEHYYL
jgi:hypothetical protein